MQGKPIKNHYQVIVDGKIVGQRITKREYLFAVVADHDIEVIKKRAGTIRTKRDFDHHMEILNGIKRPEYPYVSEYQMNEFRRQRDIGYAAWKAEGVARDLKDCEGKVERGYYGTHVVEWFVSSRFADIAAERIAKNKWQKNVRVVPVTVVKPKARIKIAPAAV
jgi:hypothetical protein